MKIVSLIEWKSLWSINFLKISFFFLSVFSCLSLSYSQDTLVVNIQKADSIFLEKNLLLLAQKYQIEASNALVQQAKLWNNPLFFSDFNLYNSQNKTFFDLGKNGQKLIGIEQLLVTAGKRNKRIQLMQQNAKLTELEFYDLMRIFKLELRNSFYKVYFNNLTLDKFDNQLDVLLTIINAFDVQYKKGNIPLKEVLRLKAVYYQLNNEKTNLKMDLLEEHKNLQMLLQTTSTISPTIEDESFRNYSMNKISIQDVIIQSMENRPDVKIAQNLANQAQLNLSLQKSLAIPDIRVNGSYDQASNYIRNYVGVGIAMDLPMFNRNQGNIQYAKSVVESYKVQQQNKSLQINNEVVAAFEKLNQIEKEYQAVDQNFRNDFELVNNGYIQNFQKRNISIVEFVDFFEAYNESIRQLNKLNERRIRFYEELNYTAGVELFKK